MLGLNLSTLAIDSNRSGSIRGFGNKKTSVTRRFCTFTDMNHLSSLVFHSRMHHEKIELGVRGWRGTSGVAHLRSCAFCLKEAFYRIFVQQFLLKRQLTRPLSVKNAVCPSSIISARSILSTSPNKVGRRARCLNPVDHHLSYLQVNTVFIFIMTLK